MKSKKNEELNFLYLEDHNTKKRKTSQAKKKQEKSKTKSKTKKEDQNEMFNFDNEIVIGVTRIPDEKEKNHTSKTTKKKKDQKTPKKAEKRKGADKKSAPQKIQKQKAKKKEEGKKKRGFIKKIVKWTSLLCALIASFIFFMMSPLFDIVEVEVTGNNAISKETIISFSEIEIGDNIYKNSKANIRKKIKQNAYVESVEIKRILPNKIRLVIKERNTTYMLEYANSYAYINNQGYILEISDKSLEVPIIMGYTTTQEELQAGNRLNKDDLSRLEMVLKIVESMESNGIAVKINRINIENKQNYTLHLEEEKKIVYLGDASNLSNRMLYLKAALEDTKGLEGEIFVNGDLIKEKAFFRQRQ